MTFSFFLQKKKSDFICFLTILQSFYQQLDLENPKIIITDWDIVFMATINKIFPQTTNLLYLRYINKCIQSERKPIFQDWKRPKEEYITFYKK